MFSEKDGELIALSLLAAGEQAHAFSAFLPSRFTIRNWVLDGSQEKIKENIANLRSGYIPALIFGLGLGGVVSYLAKSPLPFVFSVATGAAMVLLYEGALPVGDRLGIKNLNWGETCGSSSSTNELLGF